MCSPPHTCVYNERTSALQNIAALETLYTNMLLLFEFPKLAEELMSSDSHLLNVFPGLCTNMTAIVSAISTDKRSRLRLPFHVNYNKLFQTEVIGDTFRRSTPKTVEPAG